VTEGNPGSLDALVRLHQYLIRNPGPGETCHALREGCREQPCEWVTTWSSEPYRETITTELSLEGYRSFDAIPGDRITEAIIRIVDTEGPVHQAIVTRRLQQAAGFARAGARIQARIQDARVALQAAHRLRLEDEFSGWPEQFSVPCLRDWTSLPNALRQLDHVHDSELMLSLVRTVTEAGRLSREQAMNDALHRMGFIRLTENARNRMQQPLSRTLETGLLREHEGELEAGPEAFRRPSMGTHLE
jgi:hypothetical protein